MFPRAPLPIIYLFIFLFSVDGIFAQTEVTVLELGRPIERELKSGETHVYKISLVAGQFLHVVTQQKGIDAVVTLFASNGKKLLFMDSPNGPYGLETVFFVAETDDDYRLEIGSLEKQARPGRYEVKIAEIRASTPKDALRVKAVMVMAEGGQLEVKNDEQSFYLAIRKFEEAAEYFRLAEDFDNEANALFEIGMVYGLSLRNNEKAKEYFEKSAVVAERHGNKLLLGKSLRNVGNSYFSLGDNINGLLFYHRAYSVFETMGNKPSLWDLLNRMGEFYYQQGDYNKSLEYHHKALRLGETIPKFKDLFHSLHRLGMVYGLQGNYIKAFEYNQKALTQYELLGDQAGLGRIFLNIGNVYAMQGNLDQALYYYQKSLEKFNIITANRKGTGQGTAFIVIGEINRRKGNNNEALKYLQEALALYESFRKDANTNSRIASILNLLGKISIEQQNNQQALEYFQRAAELEKQFPDKTHLAQSMNNIAQIYFLQGNYLQSLDLATQAMTTAKESGALETLWQAQARAGKAHYALSQPIKAQQAFKESIETINKLRSQTTEGEQWQQAFFENKSSPFYEMVKILCDQGKINEAIKYAESFKARTLLDVLQNGKVDITKAMTIQEEEKEQHLKIEISSLNTQISKESQQKQPDQARLVELNQRLEMKRLEFEDFYIRLYAAHPELKVQRGEMKPATLEEVSKLIPDYQTALLEYVVADDKTFLFVITKEGKQSQVSLKAYPIQINRKDLSERTESFRSRLARGDLDFGRQAQDLYNLLLKPAEAQLKNKTNLVIVPDGSLWDLPFQALQTMPNKYLIESSAISYAPSLTALVEITKKNRARPASDMTLLAFGNPAIKKETSERVKQVFMSESLEPIPEAERMVSSLQKMYGQQKSQIFVGSEAREETAKQEVSKYRIVQFAAHGVLNNASPMYSHIVLSQKADNPAEDGLLEAWEMKDLDLQADMVILSACETARGRISNGEGVIGMSWALFIAGVPTTVVSQWKVESSSTTELMLEFHRLILAGRKISKAEALRQASLKLLKTSIYRHPSYWGGFVIVGDWF